MFEEFGQIKEELGVSFATLAAVVTPLIKGYVASVNRRFKELKEDFDKLEEKSDMRQRKIYEKVSEMVSGLHSLDLKVTALRGDFKALQTQINGKH